MSNNNRAVTQIINWFNESCTTHTPAITLEMVADMMDGKEFANLSEYTIDTDLDEILEFLSTDTDADELADGAIIQFVNNSRYELGLNDMVFIGEIAQEISEDVDLIWGISSQDLPRKDRMRIRIARFIDVKPEWAEDA